MKSVVVLETVASARELNRSLSWCGNTRFKVAAKVEASAPDKTLTRMDGGVPVVPELRADRQVNCIRRSCHLAGEV
jgi:hypothetical protein